MPIIFIADNLLKAKLNGVNIEDDSGRDVTWECFPNLKIEEDYLQIENDLNNDENSTDNDGNSDNVLRTESESMYISNSGFKWSMVPKLSTNRQSAGIDDGGKLINGGKNVTTVMQAFKLFIGDIIITEIVRETNRFCEFMTNNLNISEIQHEIITTTEMYAFIAIILISGMKCRDVCTLASLWNEAEANSHEFFGITMSKHRFFYIYGNIQFDNFMTRPERIIRHECKYETIQGIFDNFSTSCRQNYNPGKNINVGKRILQHQGPCPFRVQENPMAIPGMRLWVACDTKSLYISNLYIDEGRDESLTEVIEKKHIVEYLVSPHYNFGRGITTHSSMTSIQLAEELFSHDTKMTGILTLNKNETPAKFWKTDRVVGSTICAFTENLSLVSYCVVTNRILVFLSTENQDLSLQKDDRRPEIIEHHLKTNNAVRRGFSMTKNSSCVKETQSWAFRVFMEMLDISVLNAFVIWLTNYPKSFDESPLGLRHFIADLSTQLALENINIRKSQKAASFREVHGSRQSMSNENQEIGFQPVNQMIRHLPLKPQETDQHRVSVETSNFNKPSTSQCDVTISAPCDSTEFLVEPSDSTSDSVSGRCEFCSPERDRKTRVLCVICNKRICVSHGHMIKGMCCFDCSGNNND